MDFAVPADHKKNEGKWKDRWVPRPCKRTEKKTMEYESGDNCNLHAWYSHQRIRTETGGLENKRTNGDGLHYNIAEISHKSPGNLRRLAVTQTPVGNHLLMLKRKTLKWVK